MATTTSAINNTRRIAAPSHMAAMRLESILVPAALAASTTRGRTTKPDTVPMTPTAPSAVTIRGTANPAVVSMRTWMPAPMALPPGNRWLAALLTSCGAAMSNHFDVRRMIRCNSQLATICKATTATIAASHHLDSARVSPTSL